MITSSHNPEVLRVRNLIRHKSAREEEGLFVAEGFRLIKDLAESGCEAVEVYATGDALSPLPFKEVSERALCAMTDTKTPQGIVAVFKTPAYKADEVFSGKAPFVLLLDRLSDPGNMGTIFRSFEACGGSGILLVKGCTDPFSPKCVRSTMGSVVRLPHIFCESVGEGVKQAGSMCSKIKIFGAHMNGEDYTKADLTGPLMLILGNEASGLSEEAKSLSDGFLSVPMEGKVESLNAAVSAAVIGFEVKRQRAKGK